MIARILGNIFVHFIRIYQSFISPLTAPCCRFHPTCSEYAIESIKRHGPLMGPFYAAKRVLSCHPFNPGGYDPVK